MKELSLVEQEALRRLEERGSVVMRYGDTSVWNAAWTLEGGVTTDGAQIHFVDDGWAVLWINRGSHEVMDSLEEAVKYILANHRPLNP